MGSYVNIRTTLLTFAFLTTVCVDANISLTVSGDRVYADGIECNSDALIKCITPANTQTMTWQSNGHIIGDCTFGTCSHMPSLPYIFTFNTIAGEFDIALNPVTSNEANTTFTCDDGNDTNFTLVRVVGDFSINRSVFSLLSDEIQFTVTTGCITDSTNVKFNWILLKTVQSTDYISIQNSSKTLMTVTPDQLFCLSDANCGGSGRSRRMGMLTLTEVVGAESFYVGVQIAYIGFEGHNRNQIFTERTYTVKVEQTPPNEDQGNSKWYVGLIVGIVAGILILAAIGIIYILKDPVRGLQISSKSISDNEMTATIQWESRFYKYKKFYMKMVNQKDATPLAYAENETGALEYRITNLALDSKYTAHVYSQIWKVPSCKTTLDISTHGQALPPRHFGEETTRRTDTSITLYWFKDKGPTVFVEIEYQMANETDYRQKDPIRLLYNETTYVLNNLQPGTEYKIKIYGVNHLGRSEGKELIVKTNAAKPLPKRTVSNNEGTLRLRDNYSCVMSAENLKKNRQDDRAKGTKVGNYSQCPNMCLND